MGLIDVWGRAIFGAAQQRGWIAGPVVADPVSGFGIQTEEEAQQAADGGYLSSSNAVYSCVKLRADMLSGLPLVAVEDDEPAENSAALALLNRPNDHWSTNRLVQMVESSLCLWGEAFIYAERGEGGGMDPSELWWLRSDRVTVVPHKDDYVAGFVYREGAQDIPIPAESMLWIRYANPLDEFSGLAPLRAAKMAADVERSAMLSNKTIFTHGNVPAGVAMPVEGAMPYTDDQMKDLERYFDKRLTGVSKRHRIAIMRTRMDLAALGFSPKDAEFIGAMGLSLEQVARAFGVPLYLLGIREGTTYANLAEARKAIWTQTLLPEASLIAGEITRQLVPMFGDSGEEVAFDSSGVPELQEDEAEAAERHRESMKAAAQVAAFMGQGLITPETAFGLLTAVGGLDEDAAAAVVAGGPPELPDVPEAEAPEAPERALAAPETTPPLSRDIEYGSADHRALWGRAVDPLDEEDKAVAKAVRKLFRRQRASILDRLRERDVSVADLAKVFQRGKWVKEFRTAYRSFALGSLEKGAAWGLTEFSTDITPNDVLRDPTARRYLERRAQRFATEVNETTWKRLRASLGAGIDDGESIADLAKRVEDVMGVRIASNSVAIARTEVLGAFNGASVIAAREAGGEIKQWVTSLDSRVRPAKPSDKGNHRILHNEIVGIDEKFSNGLDAPGGDGPPEEVIQCRCVLRFGEGVKRSHKDKARDASEVTSG